MNCNVVKDLLPLYVDDCCSEESAALVKEHLDTCENCRGVFDNMKSYVYAKESIAVPLKPRRVNAWKASVLQSVLFFVSFALITVGVALEAATPIGFTNGLWAFVLVIPATGFMLSLANWYFVRLYKNKTTFSVSSFAATLGITLCAYVWASFHYDFSLMYIVGYVAYTAYGVLLTAVLCILSFVLSRRYAAMMGKE